MGIDQVLQERRNDILRVARAYGATRVRVFGSVARGKAGPGSDFDLLVDLEPGRNLLDLVASSRTSKTCSAGTWTWSPRRP